MVKGAETTAMGDRTRKSLHMQLTIPELRGTLENNFWDLIQGLLRYK